MDKNDVISDVFSVLRIRSELYFRARLGKGVAVRVPQEKRRIRFHLILQGGCWISTEGQAPVWLSAGDVALIPNGASQVLSIEPDTNPAPLEEVVAGGALRDGMLHAGQDPPQAVLLCGFCRFDESIEHPALASLPPLMLLRIADLGAEPWVVATLRLLELEARLDAQGSSAILARLIEIAVIQATRRLTATQGEANGFVSALSDRLLARALLAIHSSPERPWRVGDLARHVQGTVCQPLYPDGRRFTDRVPDRLAPDEGARPVVRYQPQH